MELSSTIPSSRIKNQGAASTSSNSQAQAAEDTRVELVVDPLQHIAESKASTMRYEFWRKEEEVAQSRTERKEQGLNSTKNEIYQLLGLYFAFQGLIFTAIAQANHLTRSTLWIPFTLSVVSSVSAMYVLWLKLTDCAELQKQIEHERRKGRTMWRKCEKLRNNVPYQEIECEERQRVPEAAASDKTKNACGIVIWDLWHSRMGLYGAGLLLIVLVVSVIMATACVRILLHVHENARH